MKEPYWWYVLFVKTGTEYKVVTDMQRTLNSSISIYEFDCFCLESERFFRSKKQRILGNVYKKRPLFPGYVFIETNMPAKDFLIAYSNVIYNATDIIKLLHSGDYTNIALPTFERQQLEFLYRGKRILEHSVGYKEGDKVVIKYGALVEREGSIRYINRHNREAQVEFELFGKKISARVALELITKI